jgi:hypothetical protein
MADMAGLALTIQDSSHNGHIRQQSITSPIDITAPVPRLMIEDGSAADVRHVLSNSGGKI